MTDEQDAGIVDRLRQAGNDYTIEWGNGDLYDEAADEIERLREKVAAAEQASKWESDMCQQALDEIERMRAALAQQAEPVADGMTVTEQRGGGLPWTVRDADGRAYPWTPPAPAPAAAPAGWQQRFIDSDEGPSIWIGCSAEDAEIYRRNAHFEVRPVYAAPPATAVPLTEGQIDRLFHSTAGYGQESIHLFAHAIERAHGIAAAGEKP